jgi:hypothetical protein
MIEHFNTLIRHLRKDFEVNAQVQSKHEVNGMHFQLSHTVFYYVSLLYEMLSALCILGKNPDLLKNLTHTGMTVIGPDIIRYGDIRYFLICLRKADGEAKLPNTICAAQYGDLMVICLPAEARWQKSGLDWLKTYCPHCLLGDVESLPWLVPQCGCPNLTGGVGS